MKINAVNSLNALRVLLVQMTLAALMTGCGGAGTSSTSPQSTASTNPTSDIRQDESSNSDISDQLVEETTTDSSDLVLASQPADTLVAAGGALRLSVSVTGTQAYTVTWTRNGSTLSGTGSTLSISPANSDHSGTYGCTVNSDAQSIPCNDFNVNVIEAVTITGNPGNQVLTEGENANLSVQASGSDLEYQWFYNGTAIPGATSPTLDFAGISADEAGIYYCNVSNAVSTQSSNLATVTVLLPQVQRDVAISWTAPQAREDGTPIARNEISAYRVYYGSPEASGFDSSVEVPGSATDAVIQDLSVGDYKFAVTAVDIQGLESQMSDPYTLSIQ
jgi:hypothetical protein